MKDFLEEKLKEFRKRREDYVNAHINHTEIYGYELGDGGINGVLSFEGELKDSLVWIRKALEEAEERGKQNFINEQAHENKKLLDGFAHDTKNCEMCKVSK